MIAQVLKRQGVKHLFTLCGGHISPILVGAKKEGIRVIDVRQESTAVFAADAMARLTGIPGVAVVTAGPGVTNTITAIKNAQFAQSPVILLGGAVATLLKGRGALQDIEQVKLFETLVKWTVSIQQDCDIIPILEEAFDVSRSGIPGPVFIECPIDLLYDEKLVRMWYELKSGKAKPKGLVAKAVQWYVQRHVDKIFACSSKNIEIAKKEGILPFSIEEKNIMNVLSCLNEAETPLLIIGSQAMLSVDNAGELKNSVEFLNIPVYLTGMARGLLGKDHPLHVHHKRKEALQQADLVILVGMPLDFRLDYGWSIKKHTNLISINRSKKELRMNRKPDLGILADPSTFLIELSKRSENNDKWNEWLKTLQNRDLTRRDKVLQFSNQRTKYINPLDFLLKVNEIIDDKSIIIGDGGDFVATVSYLVEPRAPLSWLDPGPYGTLGVGAGFALSAKLARPEAEVWLFYGDGAAGYSIVEFDTFVRHEIPIIAVVGNDAGWTQIAREQIEYLNDNVGTVLEYSNYDLVAEGFGAKGLILKNEEDIVEKLQIAKNICKEGKPVLINALIGKTDFRKGSISM